jgi:HAD superfamily phosphatase
VTARGFDALVLDMDGVLLDTRGSFTPCVVETARRCAGEPLGEGWSGDDVEALRLAGGFNNDWDAAAALALLGPAAGPGAGWRTACSAMHRRGGGPASVEAYAGGEAWAEVRGRVEPLFQRLYAGPSARRVYGIEPTEPGGFYEAERPLITEAEVEAAGLPYGVFTGRAPGEADLGFEMLGFAPAPERVVTDSDPAFRKPRPDGLIRLAAVLGASRPLVVGDTVDDMGSVTAARRAGMEAAFAGVAEAGSEREKRFRDGGAVVVAASLREVLRWLAR